VLTGDTRTIAPPKRDRFARWRHCAGAAAPHPQVGATEATVSA
jgi:hypothetical protein